VLAVPIAISGSAGTEGLGSFTGTFDYIPIGDFSGTLIVELTNTSPAANGGLITGFLFNIPIGVDVGAGTTLAPSSHPLVLVGGPSFSNSASGAPFGDFDIGAALGGNWLGGGSPVNGIAVGDTGTFQFNLVGTGLDGPLGPGDFLSTLSNDASTGWGEQAFVVRFKGFEDGGSDKVPMDTLGEPIPEPGTMILLSLGLASLSARRLHSRRP
jgi:hypothetical protein